MKHLKKLIAAAAMLIGGVANATVPAICTGKFFNPISDPDWNTIFPITIAGARIVGSSGNTNPPLMEAMPPVCVCPTILFGIPFVGIGITYWQPTYIAEIERRPGCLSTLGGVSVLSSYANLHSEVSTTGSKRASDANRMQMHWYEYPIMELFEDFESIYCKNKSGYNLAYVTEVDPLWQDDLWGAIFSPESSLFASPPAQAACAVDAVASSFDFSLDPLFWCAGAWGPVYPMTGNSQHTGELFAVNNQLAAKFIARSHRMGLNWQTIGPSAICSSHINPVWVKSQYRYNQVAPINRRGRAVVTGSNGKLFQFPPVTNVATQEHTINLIWQGQQCCLKPIP